MANSDREEADDRRRLEESTIIDFKWVWPICICFSLTIIGVVVISGGLNHTIPGDKVVDQIRNCTDRGFTYHVTLNEDKQIVFIQCQPKVMK